MSVKPGTILRKEQYLHFRLQRKGHLLSRGGITIYYFPEGEKAHLGMSVCSWKDTFCKRVGRKVSKSRTLGYKGVKIPQNLMTFEDLIKVGYQMAGQGWDEVGKPAEYREGVEIVLNR